MIYQQIREVKTEKIFHCGASSKDSGNKITTITEDNDIKKYVKIIEELLHNDDLMLV